MEEQMAEVLASGWTIPKSSTHGEGMASSMLNANQVTLWWAEKSVLMVTDKGVCTPNRVYALEKRDVEAKSPS